MSTFIISDPTFIHSKEKKYLHTIGMLMRQLKQLFSFDLATKHWRGKQLRGNRKKNEMKNILDEMKNK